MLRLVPLLLFVLALFSCSSKPKTGYKSLKSVSLDTVGVVMQLPASYQELSLEEEIDYCLNWNLPDEIREKKIAYLESLMASGIPMQFLADSLNYSNSIRVLRNPFYVKIGKYSQVKGFLALDESVQEMAEFLGIKFEALENDYFSLANGNDVMKVRYRATETKISTASFIPFQSDDNTYVYYATFYLVSGEGTITVIANHEVEDFEYFVRTIRF